MAKRILLWLGCLVLGMAFAFFTFRSLDQNPSQPNESVINSTDSPTEIPEETLPDENVPTNDLPVLQPFPTSSHPAFIAIHLDPQANQYLAYQAQYWPELKSLVALADEYEIKLTLCFSPQWAIYILDPNADEDRLATVHSWELEGHEIAVHHHGPSKIGVWDGYTNEEQFWNKPAFFGTMDEAMVLLSQLSSDGLITTVGILGSPDDDLDWPSTATIEINGGDSQQKKGLVQPLSFTKKNGTSVVFLAHGFYNSTGGESIAGGTGVSLEDIQKAFDSTEEGIIGLVFHERDYAADKEGVEALFKWLHEAGVEVKTPRTIVDTYSQIK